MNLFFQNVSEIEYLKDLDLFLRGIREIEDFIKKIGAVERPKDVLLESDTLSFEVSASLSKPKLQEYFKNLDQENK